LNGSTSEITPERGLVPELDGETAPAAVAAVCGYDRAAAARLFRACARLAAAADWRKAAASLDHELSARFFSGRLGGVLDIPGDIILLRRRTGGFSILHHAEGRWLCLDGEGNPLPCEVDGIAGEEVEAVVMRIPAGSGDSGGMTALAALWPQLRAAWAEVGIASLYLNAGQLLLPLFAMLVYDKIAQNGLFDTLWALVSGMGLYLATDAGMRAVRSWTIERIGENLALRGDENIWSRLVSRADMPAGGFSRFLSSYHDLVMARDFVSANYLLSVADLPFLLLYLLVIGIVAWQLMVVVIILVLLYSAAGFIQQRRLIRRSREAEHATIRKLSFMGGALASLDVVRTAPGAGAFLRSWRQLAEDSARAEMKKRLTARHMGILSRTMQTVTSVVVLTVGVYLIYGHLLSNGRLIACNLLATRAMGLVASLFAVVAKWQDFTRAAARMEESLGPVAGREYVPRPEIRGNIEVIGVSRRYEGRPAALDGVSFSVHPGERMALLGRPGAGKTTLLRCICGLCRPDSGQILFDGLALDDISRFDRVRWLAYKPQDPVVFAGTLEDNIRVSGCGSDRFAAAIWACGLENEFRSGRMSLGMTLEERGLNLSGGQRQKVALARALAQPCRILLLDEPTLGLDPESERLLAERLPALFDDDTVLIMTTHSAVMLETVERVIALDSGRVVADGPREKLVSVAPAGTVPRKAAAS